MNRKPRKTSNLERIVREALSRAGLCREGSRLVAGVSGGADSMAMLLSLHALSTDAGVSLSVAHLDHGIRGDAGADADFVESACRRLDLPLDRTRVDVPAAARDQGRSLEMQARRMRYAFFREVVNRRQADAVLTAHTRDDQAETLLLHLGRGAGPAALGGIAPDTVIGGVRVIRPLLEADRANVTAYLRAREQDWREDASNRDENMRRNAVRHRILPMLRAILNPRISEALARAAIHGRDDNACLDELADTAYERFLPETDEGGHDQDRGGTIPVAAFRMLHPALRRRILARWIRASGIAPERLRMDWIERIDALTHRGTGGGDCIELANGIEARREYDHLRLGKTIPERTGAPGETCLNVPGITRLPSFDCRADVTWTTGFHREPAGRPGAIPAQVQLRRPLDGEPLTVRTRRPGDRIVLLGMNGSKKLQDLFTDARIPVSRRDRVPIFCLDGRIAWIPGFRPARDAAVPGPKDPSLLLRLFKTSP